MPTAAEIRPRVIAALSHRPCRPLAIAGRTGVGKTALLRALAAEADVEPAWCSAVDLVEQVVEALRCDVYDAWCDALVTDPRPLVVEHLEDLRGKPRTREELRRLLRLRAAKSGATLLTSTRGRGHAEIVKWLGGWADFVSLDQGNPGHE
jgi:chromosomal replication initiation ATPase DnaA